MIFGFSLCVISLQVALITYFGLGTGDLGGEKLLEDSEICHY